MKVKIFLLKLSDFIYLKLLGGSLIKKEYKKKCIDILNNVVSIFEENEPYIFDGKWSWYKNLETGFHLPITIVFPEQALCIQVWGPEVGSWESSRLYCKNKAEWELSNKLESQLISLCKSNKLSLLNIYWNDPIDIETLSLKLEEIQELNSNDTKPTR